MKIENGEVHFSTASNWRELNAWLNDRGYRVARGVPCRTESAGNRAYLVQKVEEIPVELPEFFD